MLTRLMPMAVAIKRVVKELNRRFLRAVFCRACGRVKKKMGTRKMSKGKTPPAGVNVFRVSHSGALGILEKRPAKETMLKRLKTEAERVSDLTMSLT